MALPPTTKQVHHVRSEAQQERQQTEGERDASYLLELRVDGQGVHQNSDERHEQADED